VLKRPRLTHWWNVTSCARALAGLKPYPYSSLSMTAHASRNLQRRGAPRKEKGKRRRAAPTNTAVAAPLRWRAAARAGAGAEQNNLSHGAAARAAMDWGLAAAAGRRASSLSFRPSLTSGMPDRKTFITILPCTSHRSTAPLLDMSMFTCRARPPGRRACICCRLRLIQRQSTDASVPSSKATAVTGIVHAQLSCRRIRGPELSGIPDAPAYTHSNLHMLHSGLQMLGRACSTMSRNTSFFLYLMLSLRQPTAPVTCRHRFMRLGAEQPATYCGYASEHLGRAG